MSSAVVYVAVGALLIALTALSALARRAPVPAPALFLGLGVALGPGGIGLVDRDLVWSAPLFERLTEVAVIVSLFTIGLTMRRSLGERSWLLPLRLATVTMVLTIAGLAAVGVLWLGLSLGAAILLGAVLAPTDPVLATDVQLQDPADRDELREGLTGEAGLNDGAAFPFVMLGLGLLGVHPDATSFTLGWWAAWDVAWAVSAGLAVGALTGWLIGQVALWQHRRPGATFSLHELVVLGVIALAYGGAELIHGYGFLSVFAAGYALRYLELRATRHAPAPAEVPARAPGQPWPSQLEAPAAAGLFASSLRDFNEKLEHVLMAVVVILVGTALSIDLFTIDVAWLAPLLLLVIRPIAVALGLIGSPTTAAQRVLIAWFGIRGLGSLYYLTYAIAHGVPDELAARLVALVAPIVVVSMVAHGLTGAPLMQWYGRRAGHSAAAPS